MRFKDYFTNEFETSDNHYIPELRSRYYRNRMSDVMDAVKVVAKVNEAKVSYVDEERHEIIFENYKFVATATLTSPNHLDVAVDIKLSTSYGSFDFGRGPKIIKKLYSDLDKQLTFKGVGLYK